MRTKILAGAALLAVGGSTLVYAQQRFAPQDGPRRPMMSAEDRSAFTDARIAGLHAGLRLSPEQDKSWPAFEQAMRDFAVLRAQRVGQPPTPPAGNPIDRMAQRADALTQHGQAMKRLADAASPLYGSLDEAQKRRFAMLSRPGGGHGEGMGRHRMDGHGPDGPGMMGPRRGDLAPGMAPPMRPDGSRRERFGMMEPDDRGFGGDTETPALRERFDRWRQRSLGPTMPRTPIDGEEHL